MAEFKEVMKQYYRMFETRMCTSACPLKDEEFDICRTIGSAATDYGAEEVERIIMAWAAEHPEPQYPAWIEFFLTIGLAERDGDGYRLRVEEFNKPMDPDIARKLNVDPKEVT